MSRSSARARGPLRSLGWLLIPLGAFLLHSALFGGWLIDDAGISFAYARNLARGLGLVSQPGVAPVEGYSNPLWVLLVAALYRIGAFSIPWTPKLLAVALSAGAYAVLGRRIIRSFPVHGRSMALVALTGVAVNPSITVWSVSGLETPLLLWLLALLWTQVIGWIDAPSRAAVQGGGAGLVAAALSMTRPDAIVFAAVPPLALLAARLRARATGSLRQDCAFTAFYAAALAVAAGSLLLHRQWYFGTWLPHTYDVKGGATIGAALDLALLRPAAAGKLVNLVGAIASGAAGVVALLTLLGTAAAWARRRPSATELTTGLVVAAGAAVYAVMPADWMGEWRFGVPFTCFGVLHIVLLGHRLLELAPISPRTRQRALASAAVLWIAFGAAVAAKRSPRFAASPSVPLATVAEESGYRFNHLARLFDARNPTVLLPDVGGTLLVSELRIFDLAGLTDRTIARTLGRDQAAFHDYVFARVRPTFIHTHEVWTLAARLDDDPRFRRDYLAIEEYIDRTAFELSGERLWSGSWVRRDLAEARGGQLAEARAEASKYVKRALVLE